MLQYRIADIVINLDVEDISIMDELRIDSFRINEHGSANINIYMKDNRFIDIPPGVLIADEQIKWIRKANVNEQYYLYLQAHEDIDEIVALADMSVDCKSAHITYLNNKDRGIENNYTNITKIYTHLLIGVIFRYALLHYEGCVIHASTIKHDGKGILFSAPSGTGKSTHVKLWQSRFGEEVIVLNDDTPAVRFKDNIPHVYGSPWCGSSGVYTNDSAPLAGIVLLEQAPVNKIRKLSIEEALIRLMPRVFLPFFNQDMMSLAFSVFNRIIASVPIYLLECLPDEGAVELVHEWIK